MRFITLGPVGSNHHFVLKRYLEHHGLSQHAHIDLLLDFHEGARRLAQGEADFMLQVAVHPETATVLATYRHSIFVVDTFISESQPMAVVCKRDVLNPKNLALQPATRDYVNASRFDKLINEVSVASVAQGLIDGTFEAGITSASLVEDMPDRFRIEELIGTVDDAWIIYGRKAVANGKIISDRSGPAAMIYENICKRVSHE